MWSSLNGPFNIAKQNPQRSANELRLFKPRKLGKSFQYLAVGVGQSDCGLLQAVWMPHDKMVKQYKCQIVWRQYGACRKLGQI
jgi:hypothetical protein